jgi:hypothetical protein
MSAITFDTHKFVRKLREAGFEEKQAEAVSDAFKEAQSEAEISTNHGIETHEASIKRDIAESENRLEYQIKALEVKLGRDIEVLRAETKQSIAETNARISETKAELIRWVVAVGILQSTVIVGVLLKIAHLI